MGTSEREGSPRGKNRDAFVALRGMGRRSVKEHLSVILLSMMLKIFKNNRLKISSSPFQSNRNAETTLAKSDSLSCNDEKNLASARYICIFFSLTHLFHCR